MRFAAVHALINPPQIMTMDEPFRGLDAMIGGDEKRASALLNEQRKGGLEIALGRSIRNDETNIVNGRRAPTKRSGSFVVESARRAS